MTIKKPLLAWMLGWLLCGGTAQAVVPLTDAELGEVQGRALFNMKYTKPADEATGTGFYRLGIEGDLELNANIRKLQLGCGGVNGAGGCDVDIDFFSLSGNCASRPSCSAVMSNPFFEIAIKNPGSGVNREITGFRVSAEAVAGLLTLGTENTTVANGINSFSGYMKVQSDASGTIKGLANTAEARFDAGVHTVYGTLQALGLGGAAEADFKTVAGGFNIPAMTNLPFTAGAIVVNGTRIQSVPISTVIDVPPILLSPSYPSAGVYDPVAGQVRTMGGTVAAEVTDCSLLACLIAGAGDRFNNVQMNGSIVNIKANTTINQDLGYIHNLPVDSPFYLSFQKEATKWPGTVAADTAQKGWWMSFANPVNLGSVNPVQLIDVSVLFPQIAGAVSSYITANPATTSDLGGLLGSGVLDVGIGTVSLASYPLSLTLSDLQLSNQFFSANCYGSLKFC